MKQKRLMKKLSVVLLATTMTVSTFPQLSTSVYAADTAIELPDNTQFATVDDLKSFNTNDNDGVKNPAKVYFGDNNQQWWIVGSQNENLTLFAASSLITDLLFEPIKDTNKTYLASWNCDYINTGFNTPNEVYSNHYGGSNLRENLKKLEGSFFTDIEKTLMKETEILTEDDKNKSIYATTDKLYLPAGYFKDGYITAGVDNELRIDHNYWIKNRAWLRTPEIDGSKWGSSQGVTWSDGPFVTTSAVDIEEDVVPVFEFKLSSVIFASATPAASSCCELTPEDTDDNGAFTLRYDAHKYNKDLGFAFVPYAKDKIKLTDVPGGTYLVVQNSAGVKAKQISNETEVSAKTDFGLESFANCKVWLETTDTTNRITYATLATEEQGYNVSISANKGLTVTNGVQGVVQGDAIIDITVEVTGGYYLPDDYISNLQGQLNGLSVTKTNNGFTISGIPTSDVNITLPTVGKEYFTVEGGVRNQDWTYANGVLTIQKPGDYKIWADGSESNNRIVVSEDFKEGIITIENINLKVGYYTCPFEVNNTVDLNLILSGKNQLTSEEGRAGIEFNDSTTGSLTIDGTGSLEVQTSGGGACIGGAPFKSGNNITINNGNIIANALRQTDRPGGAGIGGGHQGSAYNLVINGGNIEAISGYYSAAIGTGADNADGDITINGGTIIAKTSIGGAAIGSGYHNTNPIKITINGGNITANAKQYAADIGSGGEQASEVYINGGTITCEKIGVGGYNDNVVIRGGSIKSPIISLAHKPALNDNGEILYPITIMNEANLDEINIDGVPFTRNGSHMSNNVEDSAFYLYLTGEDHVVKIGDKEFLAVWDNDNKQFIQKNYPLSPQDIQIEKVYKDKIIVKPIEESEYGKTEYSLDGKNYQESNIFTGLEANREYTVYVRYKGNNSYTHSKPTSVTTKTLKNGNEIVKEPSVKPVVYHDGLKLSDIKLPNGWKWENEDTSLFAGTKNHSVLFDTTNYEAEYDFTGVDGYSADNYVIQRTVEVEVQKAETVINVLTDSMDKDYDKNPINAPEVEVIGNTNSPTFEWFVMNSDETSWLECDEAPKNAGKYKVVIKVASDDNYEAKETEIKFTISKVDNELTVSLNDWVYGEKANTPNVTAKFGDLGDVVYTYSSEENGKYTIDVPTNVGTWYIKATLKGTDNYNDITVIKNFNISKATNTWVEELSITSWTYNEKVNEPTALAHFGEVTFTYSSEKNGTYTNKVPKNAGTYYVKAIVAGTENYTGLESIASFEIAKAIPIYEKVTGLVLGQGQTLSKIELPEQFKWLDETMTADALGIHTFKAIYTPKDTVNYQTIEVEIEVEVVPTPVVINHVPTISASDKTIIIGDKFEPMKDVTATDKEDGVLTSQITVIHNTVDTRKAGTYEVTYQVTDSQGATVTKTVKVTVQAEAVNPDTDNDKNDGSVETGDRTNLLLWETILIGSNIILLYSLHRKKRKTNQ